MSLVVSTVSGIVLACLAACVRSKCTTVKFCGVQIDRNVEIEEHIEEHKMDLEKKQETNI